MIRITIECDNEIDAERVLEVGRDLVIHGCGNVAMRAEQFESGGTVEREQAGADNPPETGLPELSEESHQALEDFARKREQERTSAAMRELWARRDEQQNTARAQREAWDAAGNSYQSKRNKETL